VFVAARALCVLRISVSRAVRAFRAPAHNPRPVAGVGPCAIRAGATFQGGSYVRVSGGSRLTGGSCVRGFEVVLRVTARPLRPPLGVFESPSIRGAIYSLSIVVPGVPPIYSVALHHDHIPFLTRMQAGFCRRSRQAFISKG
jgi:hypothetical protein